eukprot:9203851-Pyramimonas_sp.AAC.1
MAVDFAICISVRTTVAGAAPQVDLIRSCQRLIDDLLRAGLQLSGSRAKSSHLHIGRCLDTL